MNPVRIKFKPLLVLVSTLLTAVFLIGIGGELFYSSVRMLENNLWLVNDARLSQTANEIENKLIGMEKLTGYLKSSVDLQEYIGILENKEVGVYARVEAENALEQLISVAEQSNFAIQSIHLLTESNQIFTKNAALFPYPLPTLDQFARMDDILFMPRDSVFASEEARLRDLTFFATSVVKDNEVRGLLLVVVKIDLFAGIAGSGRLLVFNEQGDIIWRGGDVKVKDAMQLSDSLRDNDWRTKYADDGTYLVNEIQFHRWKVAYMPDNSLLAANRSIAVRLFVSVLLGCLLISFLCAELISRRLLQRLYGLMKLIGANFRSASKPYYVANAKLRGRTTLRTKLFLYLLMTVTFPVMLFVAVLFIQHTYGFSTKIKDAYFAIFEKNASELTSYFYSKQIVLKRVASSSLTEEAVQHTSEAALGRINGLLNQQTFFGLEKDSLQVYNDENVLVAQVGKGYTESNAIFYEQVKQKKLGYVLLPLVDDLGKPVLCIGMPIIAGNQFIGYVKIEIDQAFLSQKFRSFNMTGSSLFLMDDSGTILADEAGKTLGVRLYSSREGSQGISDVHLGDRRSYLFYKEIASIGIYFAGLYDREAFLAESMELLKKDGYLIATITLLTALLSFVLAKQLRNPLNRLSRKLANLGVDKSYEPIEDSGVIDEIDQVGQAFNGMIDRIEDLIDEAIVSNAIKSSLEAEKKDAEIAVLQAQISPHFLYNTLDTIKYMIPFNHSGAIQMVNALSDLFRYGINRDEIEIGIEEEVEYARAYCEIMATRYDSNVRFTWSVDQEAFAYSTIKLLLQPMIENAIEHGINESGGSVCISCLCEREHIRFVVEDNGRGIEPEELETIRQHLTDMGKPRRIGIYNVHSRLRLYYGDQGRLLLESVIGRGTRVTILIPRRERKRPPV
ncbi:sensor histidine kinase [Paenibacillus koleovorans]|uniref:sensor histidine kinase n=1 Tax=Paenibacillus koleovorans TaxID=121608 RepID=UPI000FDA4429|nr:sensor histidine kinase [Paenibacillus koleovorans]